MKRMPLNSNIRLGWIVTSALILLVTTARQASGSGAFAEGGLPSSHRASATSYAARARASLLPAGWSYRQLVHNEGSRSEYTIGHLRYRTAPISELLGHVVTPIGEFTYTRGRENSWKPAESPGWVRVEGEAQRMSSHAGASAIECTTEDRARRWYLGGFDARRRNTPTHWFYAPNLEAWMNPERRDDYEKLFFARRKLDRLVEAVEEFRRRFGDTPGDLELLITGPEDGRHWSPLIQPDELKDPWGGGFEIENFARLHARTEGRNFAIRSRGPDGVTGSGDDLDAPKPVNPQPSFFEGLIER